MSTAVAEKPRLLDRALDALENPILLRELRAAFRRKRFVVLHTTLLGLVALVLLVAMFLMSDTSNMDPSDIGRWTFLTFGGIESALVVLLFPAFSCTSITEERVANSFDLLVTTRLEPRQIVVGKTLAAVIYGVLFIVAAAPLVAVTVLYGGVSPEQIALTYATLFVAATLLTVMSIFISSVSGSTLKAVVFAYLAVFLIGPLLLAPLSYTVSIFVAGPLMKDTAMVRLRDEIRALDGVNTALLWGGLVAFYGLVTSLFFFLATNRLAPGSANRSTHLRLWFVTLVVLALGGWLVGVVHNREGLSPNPQEYLFVLTMGAIVVVFGLAAIVFAGEEVPVARRLHFAALARRGLRAPLRLFLPGPVRGGAFVLVLLVLAELVTARVFLGPPMATLGATGGELRAPLVVAAQGIAWSIAFVLFVVQLSIALAVAIAHPIFSRLWTAFILIGLTFYPVFCFYLDPPGAKAHLWQGYMLSPVTVSQSIVFEPRLPAVERQLILFGPSGNEIKDELRALQSELESSPELSGLTARERQRRLSEAKAKRSAERAAVGIPVHEVSIWVYIGLALVLAIWNRLQIGRLEAEAYAPRPAIDVDSPAPEPEPKAAAPEPPADEPKATPEPEPAAPSPTAETQVVSETAGEGASGTVI